MFAVVDEVLRQGSLLSCLFGLVRGLGEKRKRRDNKVN